VKGCYIPEHDLLRKDNEISSMLEAFINADYIPWNSSFRQFVHQQRMQATILAQERLRRRREQRRRKAVEVNGS